MEPTSRRRGSKINIEGIDWAARMESGRKFDSRRVLSSDAKCSRLGEVSDGNHNFRAPNRRWGQDVTPGPHEGGWGAPRAPPRDGVSEFVFSPGLRQIFFAPQ